LTLLKIDGMLIVEKQDIKVMIFCFWEKLLVRVIKYLKEGISMKKLILFSVLVLVSSGIMFAQSGGRDSRSSTTTQSNGVDDYIPGWQNNTTTTITDYDDGSRDVTTSRNRGLSLPGNSSNSASTSSSSTQHYSADDMRERGGNYYTNQPNAGYVPNYYSPSDPNDPNYGKEY
jgi:hypothetical protein